MARRRQAREWAMQILFEYEVNPRELAELFRDFRKDKPDDKVNLAFAEELASGAIEHLPEIDAVITKHARNWNLPRIGRVDRNVMRIALYEMLFRQDIPPVVSINEAVEIVKHFGDVGSGRFVNGILDRVREGLDRPAREAGGKK